MPDQAPRRASHPRRAARSIGELAGRAAVVVTIFPPKPSAAHDERRDVSTNRSRYPWGYGGVEPHDLAWRVKRPYRQGILCVLDTDPRRRRSVALNMAVSHLDDEFAIYPMGYSVAGVEEGPWSRYRARMRTRSSTGCAELGTDRGRSPPDRGGPRLHGNCHATRRGQPSPGPCRVRCHLHRSQTVPGRQWRCRQPR